VSREQDLVRIDECLVILEEILDEKEWAERLLLVEVTQEDVDRSNETMAFFDSLLLETVEGIDFAEEDLDPGMAAALKEEIESSKADDQVTAEKLAGAIRARRRAHLAERALNIWVNLVGFTARFSEGPVALPPSGLPEVSEGLARAVHVTAGQLGVSEDDFRAYIAEFFKRLCARHEGEIVDEGLSLIWPLVLCRDSDGQITARVVEDWFTNNGLVHKL